MMNLLLHGIEGGVELADTLSPDGERLSKVKPPAPKYQTGVFAKYVKLVSSAAEGAVTG